MVSVVGARLTIGLLFRKRIKVGVNTPVHAVERLHSGNDVVISAQVLPQQT